jgi:hypothetical protein
MNEEELKGKIDDEVAEKEIFVWNKRIAAETTTITEAKLRIAEAKRNIADLRKQIADRAVADIAR